ncbi:MAG: TMEM165/GDT1 family protein [Methylobacter sp.]|nr:TMEM165/GDT1 family protein [Methylobacter sp.]
METMMVSTISIALGEIGDKTQLLALLLATRFKKPIPIILGILFATLANHTLAGLFGAWVQASVDESILRIGLGVSFLAIAVWTLIPDKVDDELTLKSGYGVFIVTFIAFFMAEIGDKTQLVTVALAAKYHDLISVVAGTTLGMMIADVPVVFLGKFASPKIPFTAIRIIAASLFALLGVAVLAGDQLLIWWDSLYSFIESLRYQFNWAATILEGMPASTPFILQLLLMLFIILAAAELFTNALEHFGDRLKISEGVTGLVFAAVGTALPETMVPLLALLAGTSNQTINEEVGVGAILGAPLMLSTLSTCLMALAIIRRRGLLGHIQPERSGLVRDLQFFLFAFAVAAVAMFVPKEAQYIRGVLSITLVMTYFIYIMLTLRASEKLVEEGHGTEADEKMFLNRVGLPTNLLTILLQLGIGLALLVFGAKGFISGVEGLSHLLGISALLLSLLIIPIATELPEKVNSILWIRRGKDTLAFGNITGAMVFQGTLLPAIGIMLSPWEPRIEVLSGVAITFVAAAWLRINTRARGLPIWSLMVNGVLYVGFLLITLK